MKTLFIIGSGGHTRSVLSAAKLMDKWNKFEIIDLNFKNLSEIILGAKVLPLEALPNKLDFLNHDVFISIGDNKKEERFSLNLSLISHHIKYYSSKNILIIIKNRFG